MVAVVKFKVWALLAQPITVLEFLLPVGRRLLSDVAQFQKLMSFQFCTALKWLVHTRTSQRALAGRSEDIFEAGQSNQIVVYYDRM